MENNFNIHPYLPDWAIMDANDVENGESLYQCADNGTRS